jgi:hypothetical protein
VSEPKIIYLGPACEADTGEGRTWAEDDPWPTCECGHRPVQYVLGETFDRVVAERDALQLRLNAADQRIDELTGLLQQLIENPFNFTATYRARIDAILNPKPTSESQSDFAMIGIERMPPMEYDEP